MHRVGQILYLKNVVFDRLRFGRWKITDFYTKNDKMTAINIRRRHNKQIFALKST